jgi:UDP-2,4-diacetamido-2,4,6-trideoxy-beta-L-altropyranose hydrolase
LSATALFRADAAAHIGAGHVVRSLALAQEMAGFGYRPVFLSAAGTADAVPALAQSGFEVLPVAAAASGAAEARAQGHADAEIAIVDHYGLGAQAEHEMAAIARRVVAFEDLIGRAHDSDFLLDPTPGRVAADYASHVSARTRVLAGSAYALLGRRWRDVRLQHAAKTTGARPRLLVSMGSTDPGNASLKVVAACAAVRLEADIVVVLGRAAPHAASLAGFAHVEVAIDPPNLPQMLADADLVVGAPGSSSFERALLGVPSILVPLAGNQRDIADAFAGQGACLVVEHAALDDPQGFGVCVADLLADNARRAAMSLAASGLCDGRGTQRVLCALAGTERLPDGTLAELRLAEPGDGDWLLELQAHPQTRRFARTASVPTPPEHAAWFARTLRDPARLLALVACDGARSGFVRLDRAAGESPSYEISIAVAPDRHGRGIGRAALKLARRLAPFVPIDATVLAGNAASQAMFASAGYSRIGEERFRSLPT